MEAPGGVVGAGERFTAGSSRSLKRQRGGQTRGRNKKSSKPRRRVQGYERKSKSGKKT